MCLDGTGLPASRSLLGRRSAEILEVTCTGGLSCLLAVLLGLSLDSATAAPHQIAVLTRETIGSPIPNTYASKILVYRHLAFVCDNRWNPYHDGIPEAGGNYGGVHVFDLTIPSRPVRRRTLRGSDSADETRFGSSISANGSLVAVGAPLQDSGIGAVYLFQYDFRGNAVECYKIVSSDRSPANFGASVALYGKVLLAGAPGGTGGTVYVFDVSNDEFARELTHFQAPSPVTGDGFGSSLAISGGLVISGAPMGPASPGKAFIHDISNPSSPLYRSTIQATMDASNGDGFGTHVDIEGAVALVGVPGRDDNAAGDDTGAAFLFDLSNPFSPTGVQILANDRVGGDRFGTDVSIAGPLAVVGPYRFDISTPASPFQTAKLSPASPYSFTGKTSGADDRIAVVGPVGHLGAGHSPKVALFNISDSTPYVSKPLPLILLEAIQRKTRTISSLSRKLSRYRRTLRRLRRSGAAPATIRKILLRERFTRRQRTAALRQRAALRIRFAQSLVTFHQ